MKTSSLFLIAAALSLPLSAVAQSRGGSAKAPKVQTSSGKAVTKKTPTIVKPSPLSEAPVPGGFIQQTQAPSYQPVVQPVPVAPPVAVAAAPAPVAYAAPAAVAAQPVAVAAQPVAVAAQPVAVAAQPVAVAAQPVAMVAQPVAMVAQPMAVAAQPVAPVAYGAPAVYGAPAAYGAPYRAAPGAAGIPGVGGIGLGQLGEMAVGYLLGSHSNHNGRGYNHGYYGGH